MTYEEFYQHAFSKPTVDMEKYMNSTKVNADEYNGIPVKEREPDLTFHFRINGMPQEFTEAGAIEIATELLKKGITSVSINRVIRDKATGTTLQEGRY